MAAAGRAEAAIGWLRTNLVAYPEHSRTLSVLADILANQGQTNEALLVYEKRLSLKPVYPPTTPAMPLCWREQGEPQRLKASFALSCAWIPPPRSLTTTSPSF